MHQASNEKPVEIVYAFYEAFKKRDAHTMNSRYSEHLRFSDPVFPNLNSVQTKTMWLMLCKRAKNFSLAFEILSSNSQTVIVNWQARYTFQQTGRPVHNKIRATLKIENGKIIEHNDDFDFYRWSKQALGLTGVLLGWTPFLKHKIQKEAHKALKKFMDQNPAQN